MSASSTECGAPDARGRVLAGTLLLLFGLAAFGLALNYARQDVFFPDFFALWSFGRMLAAEGAARIYDQHAVQSFQQSLDPLFADRQFPYLYPPTFLLFVSPLGKMSYAAARLVWALTTLLLFLFALFGTRWRGPIVLASLVAPATVVSLIYGQNGFLTAALLIGGLRSVRSRPVLAGVLLGLLSYKPQFAALIPVALMAGRHWRAFLVAGATGAATVVVSGAAFGPSVWLDWWAANTANWETIKAVLAAHDSLMPTVSANLHMLGVAPNTTAVVQATSALAAASFVWVCWRRDRDGVLAVAAVPVAALLATPYAFVYDLPMVAGAVLLIIGDELSRRRPLSVSDMLILALALELPQLMFASPVDQLPIAVPVLALLLWWIVRRLPRATGGRRWLKHADPSRP